MANRVPQQSTHVLTPIHPDLQMVARMNAAWRIHSCRREVHQPGRHCSAHYFVRVIDTQPCLCYKRFGQNLWIAVAPRLDAVSFGRKMLEINDLGRIHLRKSGARGSYGRIWQSPRG